MTADFITKVFRVFIGYPGNNDTRGNGDQQCRNLGNQAITDGQWRATFNADTGEASELFDLGADPDEATNLVGEPAASEMLGALHDQLTSRLETV